MKHSFMVHDVETTGLLPETAKIIEVGSVVVMDGLIVGEFSSLSNPGKKYLPPDDFHGVFPFNNIPVDAVREAKPEEQVAKEWNEWRRQWEIQHHSFNVPFDSGFLKLDPWLLVEWGECIMKASQDEMGARRWPKLIASAAHFGVSFGEGEAHRAGVDARVAAEVYVEILKRRAERAVHFA